MDYRIESDIAYIKSAVSDYVRHAADCPASKASIDQIRRELESTRSKVHELDMFQAAVKGILTAVAISVVSVLILVVLKNVGRTNADEKSQEADASEQVEAAAPGTR
jgi:hypothetical protein